MPSTTTYSFGDVVLVPFPFTDQSATKKRPAVVVSSDAYNRARPDVIVIAVTSHMSAYPRIGEVIVSGWKKAGLLKASNYQANSRHNRKWSSHSSVRQTHPV